MTPTNWPKSIWNLSPRALFANLARITCPANLFVILVVLCIHSLHSETLQGKLIERISVVGNSEKPISGVQIILYDTLGKKLIVKKTNKNGVFLFPKLNPGVYALEINSKNYFPSHIFHFISISPEDTLSHEFAFDKILFQKGMVARFETSRKKTKTPAAKNTALKISPYENLAESIASTLTSPNHWKALFRDDLSHHFSLSQVFDAEDTTLEYKKLWMELIWAELENQNRPTASLVYLAHALDSLLQENNCPSPSGMKPFLKVSSDSLESALTTMHSVILNPSKKNNIQLITQKNLPKSLLVSLIEDEINSKLIPKPKKKKFLIAARGILGSSLTNALSQSLEPPRKVKRPNQKPVDVFVALDQYEKPFWNVMEKNYSANVHNSVAGFVFAQKEFNDKQYSSAINKLEKINLGRPDYPRSLALLADAYLKKQDTVQAANSYDSLSKVDSPDWQATAFRKLAQIQFGQGLDEKAETSLWRARGLDSKSFEARKSLYLLAEVALQRGTSNPVEKLLDTLASEKPREAEVYFWLGKMALKNQQDGVALENFQHAQLLNPRQINFTVACAELYFSRDEFQSALKILKPIHLKLTPLGLDIYGQCLMQTGQSKEAVEEFAKSFSKNPNSQILSQYAKALVQAGQAEKAISLIESSSIRKNLEVKKALAEAKIKVNKTDDARQILQTLLKEKETDAEIYFLIGLSHFQKRNYSDASSAFTSALQYREDYPQAKFEQGLCLLKLGRAGEAHHYFLELVDTPKQSWHAKGLLGQGQAFAKENKLDAAVENFQKSFAAQPSAETAAHLASTFVRMENLDDASLWAAKATKLNPSEPLALLASTDVLFAAHKDSQALELAKNGMAKNPESCEFIIIAAKASLKAEQDDMAKELSLKAKSICPEESAPYFFLGTVAQKKGILTEARQHFDDYMRTGGDAKRVPVAFR